MFSGQSGKSLRQALAYSINKSLWPNRAYGPVSPLSWAFNPEVKKNTITISLEPSNFSLELKKTLATRHIHPSGLSAYC